MARESKSARRTRLAEVLKRLKDAYPAASCSLRYGNPFQLLVSTILSAQCTDERVNKVTPGLFLRYPGPEDFARLTVEEIGKEIYSTGFYNNKARSIRGMSLALLERYGGEVPRTLEELVSLPGVGRKTANVVLGNAFGIPGITVDTHVTRITNLLGLVKTKDAVKIEKELMEIMDREDWTLSAHLFIEHGRAVCIARRPRCSECVLADLCPGAIP
ncbi:MAG: endonuclease III [FCB group bacterium]|nr:endonuclease III [FCB group bacterium]